jgi:hypothetical protein
MILIKIHQQHMYTDRKEFLFSFSGFSLFTQDD